jgi:hypothetical protein
VIPTVPQAHDVFCGTSSDLWNERKYGDAAPYGPSPSGRALLTLAAGKNGLTPRDLTAQVSADGETPSGRHCVATQGVGYPVGRAAGPRPGVLAGREHTLGVAAHAVAVWLSAGSAEWCSVPSTTAPPCRTRVRQWISTPTASVRSRNSGALHCSHQVLPSGS